MKIIGITGGVGTGKSTVLAYLEEKFSACVLQADQIGHLVMEPGERCYEPVIRLFGKEIVREDRTLDRKKISDIVFVQPDKLECLNRIVHPAVEEYLRETIKGLQKTGRKLCVVEAALLLEEHYEEFCDEVWYVHTDKEIRILRLMESRGYTREKSESIIANQATEEFFRTHADYIVENNGDLACTYRQIEERIRGIKGNETL